jgi:hypothetical protein
MGQAALASPAKTVLVATPATINIAKVNKVHFNPDPPSGHDPEQHELSLLLIFILSFIVFHLPIHGISLRAKLSGSYHK